MLKIKHTVCAGMLACLMIAGASSYSQSAHAAEVKQPDDSTSTHITTPDKDGNTGHPHGRHGHHGRKHILLKDAADLLGMSVQDLGKEWKQGKNLQQIAKEKKGWGADEFVQKLTTVQSSKIDAAVKAGKMTKEHADQLKKKLPDSLKRFTQHTYRPQQDRLKPGAYSHI